MRTVTIQLLRVWAFQDDLTKLSNRRHLGLIERERQTLEDPTYFVVIDLDGFKAAQDRPEHGHDWGDRLLRRFARFLLRSTRQIHESANRRGGREVRERTVARDVVCGRQGGDEFLVLTTTLAGAEEIAARVSRWEQDGVRATAGVGATRAEADAALYGAKRAKKSRNTPHDLALWRRVTTAIRARTLGYGYALFSTVRQRWASHFRGEQ